ncbi:hypothetical protein HID58_092298 [Brassica napus]|uniref:Methyltransferase type 11 domain-containing protein n=1 Tax=Brassica napus TaxID=3708 RepID=A0ABQ7WX09_BRANA|nr:hypothetical protein HID58_092298 [Brassica napus]
MKMVKANVLSKIRGFSGVNRPIYVLAGLAFLISVATLAKFNYITPLRFSGRFCNNHGSFDGDNYILGSQMRKTIESAIFKIHQEMDDLKALEANSSAPPSDSSASGSMFRHVAFLADVLSLIQSVHMELPSLEEVDHPLKQRNGDPGEHFMREEIKKYIKIKPNRLGKQNFMGANGTFTSIGHACFAMKKDLEEYMDYDVGEICNDDWRLAQKLMVHGCDPLPRRRCFSRAPQLYYKPFPINEWVNRGELDPETNQTADFSIQEVLEIKPGEIRIGLDFSVGTGTFAARMRESNVTIVTATINLGAPFNEMISLRGLVPLYLTVNQRLPFFDSTLDMIHTTRFLDGWIDLILLDFVLFDWDRVLRPGGLLWIDSFFCLKEDLGDYMEAFKALRYRRHKWVVVPKRDKDDKEVFFSAVMLVDSLDAQIYEEHHQTNRCYLSLTKVRNSLFLLSNRSIHWFEYTTLKTMDEDLAEEACILRRLWPGSIEKEKQRMNVKSQVSIIYPHSLASLFDSFNSQAVSLRKKKERRWKLETLRRLRLKEPTGKLRQFQTYASFLFSKTSGISIEICSVGYLRTSDRNLISYQPPPLKFRLSSCFRSVVLLEISTVFLTLRPGELVIDASELPADFFKSVQEKGVESHREQKMIKSRSVVSFDDQGGSSKDNSLSGSVNFSYVGTDLMWSSPLPSPLRDWNAIRNQAG